MHNNFGHHFQKRNVRKNKKIMERGMNTIRINGGDGSEFYSVNLYVGTPPQMQSVILDTSSTDLNFPCSTTCQEQNCGKHKQPYFNTEISTTNSEFKCGQKFS